MRCTHFILIRKNYKNLFLIIMNNIKGSFYTSDDYIHVSDFFYLIILITFLLCLAVTYFSAFLSKFTQTLAQQFLQH